MSGLLVWPVSSFVVPNLRRDLLFAVGWSSNWGTISGGGDYWARFGDPSPLTHYWSLAIEEQFYLVWPVVLVCVVGCGRRLGISVRTLVGGIALAGAIASATYMVVSFDPLLPTATYMNTFARAHSLLFGAAAAALTTNVGTSLRGGAVARRLAPPAALVLVAIVL